MSYVHPYSKRCEKSKVDLFSVPPTQLSLEKGRWIDYRPLSTVENNDSPITFMIAGTDEYIDLSKTILVVEGKISNISSSTAGQANVAPINNFLHSLIKQVDVYLNGKQATPAMGTYAYRSYIETLLNYDVSAKNSQLSSALYFKDTPGRMEDSGALPSSKTISYAKGSWVPTGTNTNSSKANEPPTFTGNAPGANDKDEVSVTVPGTGNQGFAKRHEFIKNGRPFVLSGPIFSDVFMGDRLLLNMMDLKVVLNRTPNAFCLKETGDGNINPEIGLTSVVLKIRKVKVDQAVSNAIEVMLKQTPALYPLRRVECKALTIPSGLPNVRKDNIFSGTIPKSFVFGLVEALSYNGTYGKNPYNFQHFGVSNITLTVNGEEVPFKQLRLEYPNEAGNNETDFIQAYNTLFSGTGKMYANTGLDIGREDYPYGYTLYAFDLTPDMCNTTEYFNTVQRGSLSVDITFREQTKAPIAMVCYGDFENIMRIDSERNVIYDIS